MAHYVGVARFHRFHFDLPHSSKTAERLISFWLLLRLAPMLILAGLSLVQSQAFRRSEQAACLCLLWAVATSIEAVILGRFYGHYGLPSLAALASVAVPILCCRLLEIAASGFLFLCVYLFGVVRSKEFLSRLRRRDGDRRAALS